MRTMAPGPGGGAIVVTGAANGIGAAVAERLRADGRLVIGLDMEPCPAQPSLVVDVADIDGHERLLESIAAEHGRIWGLANVAGISMPEPIAALTVAAYRRQLAVMLDGPIWLTRAAGRHMVAHGGGRIVNITSIHAQNSERGAVAYDAAKGGLEAATRTLAIELGEGGVLVNSVAPGFVRTRMSIVDGHNELDTDWFREGYVASGRLPLGRAAEPGEIAPVVSFLLSPENTYVSGARIVVDGALTVGF
jgi:NAD(P)-dependent dehydrogenase (short-subunit alcohol dehydrogenase family)